MNKYLFSSIGLAKMEQQTKTLTDKLENVAEILNKIHTQMAKMNNGR